ncbi:hypothetical protein [Mitsuaria sp. 7]|uniref:hypothetical protein n=1 Tax=Mitsuaria sp. 7 TaxID=1658665 RepID=UPI0007DCD5D7|nr:hypothetical protein [Mitsuaria sp. 7]ANH67196.1 hypothetical protein ABE85_05740 [Mitsuaria sp. 7]
MDAPSNGTRWQVMTMEREHVKGYAETRGFVSIAPNLCALSKERAPETRPEVFAVATAEGTAHQLAELLGIPVEEVVRLEQEHRLFSVYDPTLGRSVYPLFQAMPDIAGPHLEAILAQLFEAMKDPGVWLDRLAIWGFFTTPHMMLAWSTPLEVLLGHRIYDMPIDSEVELYFSKDAELRFSAVLGAVHDEIWHRRH